MNIDIFRPVPREARRENLAAYQKFLTDRDGVLDLDKQQLSHRETGMARYERPLSRIREIDRHLFGAQYESFDSKVETSPELLLLLALTKVNAAEAYGVYTGFESTRRRALENDDGCELMVLVEETYHTRILVSTALSYGIEVKAAYKPPSALRALIAAIVKTPTGFSRPMSMAAEVLGVLLFLNLLEKSRVILRHDPELRDSVEERLCEIMTDEIGHVSYNRACIGPVGMAEARAILPMVAMVLTRTFPEVTMLGAMASASRDEVAALASGRRLPEQVMRSAFIS
jgi:hypothetical protein